MRSIGIGATRSLQASMARTHPLTGASMAIESPSAAGEGAMPAIIGRSTDTNEFIRIGDIERRAGFYVLGKPRMGKSTLLVNLLIQDIENGHGVFFLDPHGKAIEDV